MSQLKVGSHAGSFITPFEKNFVWAAARRESMRDFHNESPFVWDRLVFGVGGGYEVVEVGCSGEELAVVICPFYVIERTTIWN
jgi:hypothetical protein